MDTVAAIFDTTAEADQAVRALEAGGIDKDYISVLAQRKVLGENSDLERPAKDVVGNAGIGAVGGGAVGGLLGLLAGLGAIVIPGIGPAVAAGAIASGLGLAAGGAGVGAAVGGILGAMTALSIPEQDAQKYAQSIERGSILVAVQADGEHLELARRILSSENPQELH